MSTDILRLVVAVLAVFVVGGAVTVAVRYLLASWRLGRSPGRILARHVAEVASGTAGLASGYAAAVAEQLGYHVHLTAVPRLWVYLVSMVLLVVGVIEVGAYQRIRARSHPQRQEQVRAAVRAAMEGHQVRGPRSADRVAVPVTNAVLALEGTPRIPEPTLPEPDTPPRTDPISATGYGRHALRRDRRVTS